MFRLTFFNCHVNNSVKVVKNVRISHLAGVAVDNDDLGVTQLKNDISSGCSTAKQMRYLNPNSTVRKLLLPGISRGFRINMIKRHVIFGANTAMVLGEYYLYYTLFSKKKLFLCASIKNARRNPKA